MTNLNSSQPSRESVLQTEEVLGLVDQVMVRSAELAPDQRDKVIVYLGRVSEALADEDELIRIKETIEVKD